MFLQHSFSIKGVFMKLTDNEYKILEKLENNILELGTDDFGNDTIIDKVEDKIIPLEEGILSLASMNNIGLNTLSKEELLCFQSLVFRAKILNHLSRERLATLLYNSLTLIEEKILSGQSLKNTKIQRELDILDEEYDFLITEYGCFENSTNSPAERRKIFN